MAFLSNDSHGFGMIQGTLYYILKNILRCLPLKRYLSKYSSVDWDQLSTIFRWWAVGKLSSSFEMTGVEGFQSLISGNTTYIGKCYGESCLRIAVVCYIRAYSTSTVDSCKGIIHWRKKASISFDEFASLGPLDLLEAKYTGFWWAIFIGRRDYCISPMPLSHFVLPRFVWPRVLNPTPVPAVGIHRIDGTVSRLAACTTYFLSLAASWSYTLDIIISCVRDSFWLE
jgi:hypothetical protein